ncbi:hypothetical protein SCANM63S_02310 [Streptomyces canarius]
MTEAYVRLGGAPEHADLLIARFGQHIDDFGALVPADRHVAIVAQKLLRGTPQDVDAAVQHARSAGITVSEPERPVTGAATHARPGDEAALKVEDRPALDTAKTFLGTVPPEDLARAEQWARTQVSNDHTWFLDGHHPDAAERRELLGAFVTLLSHSLLTDSVDAARALSLDLARRYGTRRTTGLPGGVDLDEADFLQSPERFPTAGPSRDGNTLEQLMEDIQRRFDELNFDDLDFEDRPETMVGHVTEADEVLPPVVRNVPEDETFVVEELSDDDVELHELPNGHDSGLDESTEHPFVVEVESDGHRGPDEVLTGHVSEPGEELPPHAATVTDTHDDAPEPIFAQAADENPNLPEDFRELTRPIRSYIARAAAQKAEKAKGVKGAKDPEDAEIILMSYPGAHNIVELIRTAGTGHAFVAVRLPGREAPVNLGFRVIEDVSHGRLVDGTAPGGVTHEAADAFDHFSAEILRSYKVDAEQLEKAYQYAEEKSRATYNLIKYNCVVFAQEFVHAATGADMPKLTVNAPNSLIEEMRVGTHRDWVENPRFLELTPEDRLHLERANAWLNNHDRTSEMRWALDRVFIDHQRPVVSGTPSRIQQRQLDLLAHIGTLAAEKYHHAGEAAALELLHDLGVKYGTSRHDHPQIRQTVEHMLEPLRSYAEHAVDPGAKDAEVVVMADQNGQPSLGIRLPGNPRLIGMRFGVGRQDAGTLGWEMKEGSLFLEHSDRPFDPDIEILKTFPVSAAQVLTGYQYALDNIATPYKASSYNSFTFTQEFLTKVLGSDPVASRPTNFSFSKTFNAVFKPETHASSAFHQTMQADVDRSWSKANTPVTELTDTHKESLDRLAHEPVYNTREEFDAAQAWAKLRVALDHQKPSNEQDPETGAAMHDLLRSFRYLIAATYHTQGEHAARQLSWQLGTEHGTWRPTDKRPPQPQQPAHEPVSQHQHTTPEPLATQQPLPERPATPEPLTTPHQHDVLLGDASQPMTDENGFHRFDTADGGTVFISNAHINAQNAVTPAVANLVTKFLNGGLPIHRVHPVTAPRRGYQGEPVTILPAGEAQSPRHDDVESTSFVTFSTTPEGAEHDFRMSGATRSGLSAGLLVDAFVGPDQTIAVIDDKTIQVRDLTVATFADRGPITVFNRPPQQSPDITVLNVRVDENPYKQALTQELTRTDLSPEHRARLQAALNTYDTQITDVAFAPQTPLRPDHTDAGATESTTTGPDTHIGDRVSDTERAAHLEDFAGHWRRWEKSPVRDGGPQELVAGVPIHDALLTAVRLLGHSPEPGFTTRLDETTDPAELSRLEQDALIVADHLLQHPADLPGAMTLGLRLLSDAPYRHDTRLPGGARPEDSGGTWRDMIRSSFSVLRLNQDPRPTTNSRQLAITHIDKVLKDAGLEGQETVGSGIARSIEAIRVAAGENGARDIHTVFQRPELAELYKIPADDPRAEQAHRFIAEQELAYWKKQHAENPTIGTKIAIDVPVATRVQLQKTVGSATDWAERFRKAGTSIGDPFGGSFQFRADTSDSAISGLKHLLSNPDITSRLSEEHLQTLTHALNSYGHQPDTSQTTGPDTHTGDPVSGEERATHLEDFAGHWRRWEKSPVHDGGPQELVAGTPIHDALLTAVQLLGHSPEPGFTSRLENTAGDLISLSRLEQDALIVAGHLLQHPADLPGAMTLGLRLLTDAPYRHDTRLPGGTRPEDSGGTWRDMIRSSFSVLRLNQDPRPTTNSRQLAITHIDKVLKDSGLEGQETVGSGIARSIEAIRVAAGENGARDIHTVFQRPELAELYKIPADDPRAEQAHRFIAEQELAYWKKQHAENPTIGTKIAIDVPVATRVQLQKTVGSATDWAERFRKAGTSIGDPFGGSFQFRADTSDSTQSGIRAILNNPDIAGRLSEDQLHVLKDALATFPAQTPETTGPVPLPEHERATHLEDFAGHWRRWEKSPAGEEDSEHTVLGPPERALATAFQLLGHSPEPGFTTRLENTAGDLTSLSRLEQDALIVADHLLQHPADEAGVGDLVARLLTDAPYRHDTRLPGGARPEDSGGTWRDMIRSSFSVLRLNQDPRPTTNSRQLAITHIDKVLKDSGLEGQETVGSGIARSIEAIRVAAGENGARDIHTVFQRPELADLYKIPADDPRAEQAHRFIAEQELAYWKKQHAENPTIGTKIAIDVPVATRVQLQKTVGSATDWAERFRKAGTSIGDPFGGSFQFRADTSDSTQSGIRAILNNPEITSRLSEEHLQTLTHALNSYGHQPDTSQTTGPDTHTGDPVSDTERATHLEDFAGHWRRWEKSPVHDGGPQELVAGTPIHDALLTAVQLLGHSPEPGFTTRLENTAGDLTSLSRLEQDALIVADHLLQHPADLPGAMTLGLRLLTDAPYRHDTRLPGGARPEDSGGTWRDMIRSSFSVLRLNQDPRPTTNSRQLAITHIDKVLKDSGLEGQETVGSGIARSIEAIRVAAGENGARDIHTVFQRPELADLYKIPADDPRAEQAHRFIAEQELAYWKKQHAENPTIGTKIAVDVPVATRVQLQKTVGSATDWAERFRKAGTSIGDPFGGSFNAEPPAGAVQTAVHTDPPGLGVDFYQALPDTEAVRIAQSLIDVPAGVERPVAARLELTRQLSTVLADPDTAARVAASGVRVRIIPRTSTAAETAGLPDSPHAPDGRPLDTVRGATLTDHRLVLVAEENLLGEHTPVSDDQPHQSDGYSSVSHELHHLIYHFGLTDTDRDLVGSAFTAKKNAGPDAEWADGPLRDADGNDNYASRDVEEYFAQTANAYLGANHGNDPHTGLPRNNGVDWVDRNEPGLAPLLHRLYDSPAPSETGHNPVNATTAENSLWQGFRDITALNEREPVPGEPDGVTTEADGQPVRPQADGHPDVTQDLDGSGVGVRGEEPPARTDEASSPVETTRPSVVDSVFSVLTSPAAHGIDSGVHDTGTAADSTTQPRPSGTVHAGSGVPQESSHSGGLAPDGADVHDGQEVSTAAPAQGDGHGVRDSQSPRQTEAPDASAVTPGAHPAGAAAEPAPPHHVPEAGAAEAQGTSAGDHLSPDPVAGPLPPPPARMTVVGQIGGADRVLPSQETATAVLEDVVARLDAVLDPAEREALSADWGDQLRRTIWPSLSAMTRGEVRTLTLDVAGFSGEVPVRAEVTRAETVGVFDSLEFEDGSESLIRDGFQRDKRSTVTGGLLVKGKAAEHTELTGNLSSNWSHSRSHRTLSSGRLFSRTKTPEPALRIDAGVRLEFDFSAVRGSLGKRIMWDAGDGARTSRVQVSATVPVATAEGDTRPLSETPDARHYTAPLRVEQTQALGGMDTVRDVFLVDANGERVTGTLHESLFGSPDEPTSLESYGRRVFGSDWSGVRKTVGDRLDSLDVLQYELKGLTAGEALEIELGGDRGTLLVSAEVTSMKHVRNTAKTEFNTGSDVTRVFSDAEVSEQSFRAALNAQSGDLHAGPTTVTGTVQGDFDRDGTLVDQHSVRTGTAIKMKVPGAVFDGTAALTFVHRADPLGASSTTTASDAPATAPHTGTSASAPPRGARARIGFQVLVDAGDARAVSEPTVFSAAEQPQQPRRMTGTPLEPGDTAWQPSPQVWTGLPAHTVVLDVLAGEERSPDAAHLPKLGDLLDGIGRDFFASHWRAVRPAAHDMATREQLATNLPRITRGTTAHSIPLPAPLRSDAQLSLNGRLESLEYLRVLDAAEVNLLNDVTDELSTRMGSAVTHGEWAQAGVEPDLGNDVLLSVHAPGAGIAHRYRTGAGMSDGYSSVASAKYPEPMVAYIATVSVDAAVSRPDVSGAHRGRTQVRFVVAFPQAHAQRFEVARDGVGTQVFTRPDTSADGGPAVHERTADPATAVPGNPVHPVAVGDTVPGRPEPAGSGTAHEAPSSAGSPPRGHLAFQPPARVVGGRIGNGDVVLELPGDRVVAAVKENLSGTFGEHWDQVEAEIGQFFDSDALQPRTAGLTAGETWGGVFKGGPVTADIRITSARAEMTRYLRVVKDFEFEHGTESAAASAAQKDGNARRSLWQRAGVKVPHVSFSVGHQRHRDVLSGSSVDHRGGVVSKDKTVEPAALFEGDVTYTVEVRLPHVLPGADGGRRTFTVVNGGQFAFPVRDLPVDPTTGDAPGPEQHFRVPDRIARTLRLGADDVVLDVRPVGADRAAAPDAHAAELVQDVLRQLDATGPKAFGSGRKWEAARLKLAERLHGSEFQRRLRSMMAGQPWVVRVNGRELAITASVKAMTHTANTRATEFNSATLGVTSSGRTDPHGSGPQVTADATNLTVVGTSDPLGASPAEVFAGGTLTHTSQVEDIADTSTGVRSAAGTKTKVPGSVFDGVARLHVAFRDRRRLFGPGVDTRVPDGTAREQLHIGQLRDRFVQLEGQLQAQELRVAELLDRMSDGHAHGPDPAVRTGDGERPEGPDGPRRELERALLESEAVQARRDKARTEFHDALKAQTERIRASAAAKLAEAGPNGSPSMTRRTFGVRVRKVGEAEIGFQALVQSADAVKVSGAEQARFEAPRPGSVAPRPATETSASTSVVPQPPRSLWTHGMSDGQLVRDLPDVGSLRDLLDTEGRKAFGGAWSDVTQVGSRRSTLVMAEFGKDRLMAALPHLTRGGELRGESFRVNGREAWVSVRAEVVDLTHTRPEAKAEVALASEKFSLFSRRGLHSRQFLLVSQLGARSSALHSKLGAGLTFGGGFRYRSRADQASGGRVFDNAKIPTPLEHFDGHVKFTFAFHHGDSSTEATGVVPVGLSVPASQITEHTVVTPRVTVTAPASTADGTHADDAVGAPVDKGKERAYVWEGDDVDRARDEGAVIDAGAALTSARLDLARAESVLEGIREQVGQGVGGVDDDVRLAQAYDTYVWAGHALSEAEAHWFEVTNGEPLPEVQPYEGPGLGGGMPLLKKKTADISQRAPLAQNLGEGSAQPGHGTHPGTMGTNHVAAAPDTYFTKWLSKTPPQARKNRYLARVHDDLHAWVYNRGSLDAVQHSIDAYLSSLAGQNNSMYTSAVRDLRARLGQHTRNQMPSGPAYQHQGRNSSAGNLDIGYSLKRSDTRESHRSQVSVASESERGRSKTRGIFGRIGDTFRRSVSRGGAQRDSLPLAEGTMHPQYTGHQVPWTGPTPERPPSATGQYAAGPSRRRSSSAARPDAAPHPYQQSPYGTVQHYPTGAPATGHRRNPSQVSVNSLVGPLQGMHVGPTRHGGQQQHAPVQTHAQGTLHAQPYGGHAPSPQTGRATPFHGHTPQGTSGVPHFTDYVAISRSAREHMSAIAQSRFDGRRFEGDLNLALENFRAAENRGWEQTTLYQAMGGVQAVPGANLEATKTYHLQMNPELQTYFRDIKKNELPAKPFGPHQMYRDSNFQLSHGVTARITYYKNERSYRKVVEAFNEAISAIITKFDLPATELEIVISPYANKQFTINLDGSVTKTGTIPGRNENDAAYSAGGNKFFIAVPHRMIPRFIIHEFGHQIARQSNPLLYYTTLNAGWKDDSHKQRALRTPVSSQGAAEGYAGANPAEFVAEAFTALVEGKQLPPDIEKMYRALGGPMPRGTR